MITKEELSNLNNVHLKECFVSSLYLNVDGRRFNKRDYEIKLKDMIKERKQEIEGLGLDQKTKDSLLQDFDNMYNYISLDFDGKRAKSLAIFSCSDLNLWRVYELPQSVRPQLVVNRQPYTLPLVSLINENKRYFVIISSREKARLFEYYMGELREKTQILDEVQSQVKTSRWYELEERRIERHIENQVQRHFKNVALGVHNYYQRFTPDYIIIGGRKEIISEFERHLDTHIQERVIARIRIDVDAQTNDIWEVLGSTVHEFERNEQNQLINRLIEEAESGRMGVIGIKATLRALWHGQVRTLFVTEDHTQPGYYCPKCWYMSNNERTCPMDNTSMQHDHDIVEDALESAMLQNCEIIRVKDKNVLKDYEHMGAFLRFTM